MSQPLFDPPTSGTALTMGDDGTLNVPNDPIIPFIEGDGIGRDIWKASERVFDAAVEKAYKGDRKIQWYEVFAGQKAFDRFDSWLPDDTVEAFRTYLVGIKGPLTTPIGGGIRSLNVALRQRLDLYVCLRPVRWFKGVPSPVKNPQDVYEAFTGRDDKYGWSRCTVRLMEKGAALTVSSFFVVIITSSAEAKTNRTMPWKNGKFAATGAMGTTAACSFGAGSSAASRRSGSSCKKLTSRPPRRRTYTFPSSMKACSTSALA